MDSLSELYQGSKSIVLGGCEKYKLASFYNDSALYQGAKCKVHSGNSLYQAARCIVCYEVRRTKLQNA